MRKSNLRILDGLCKVRVQQVLIDLAVSGERFFHFQFLSKAFVHLRMATFCKLSYAIQTLGCLTLSSVPVDVGEVVGEAVDEVVAEVVTG